MWNTHGRTLPALAAVMAAGLLTSAAHAESYPPSRNADTLTPPPSTKAPTTSCTATGTWSIGSGPGDSGDGSWTGTAKNKCHAAGRWTDAYGYTWRVKKGATRGALTGSVNYNGVAPCQYQVWPLTGQSDKPNFTVTAVNPNQNEVKCAQYFEYSLTIQ